MFAADLQWRPKGWRGRRELRPERTARRMAVPQSRSSECRVSGEWRSGRRRRVSGEWRSGQSGPLRAGASGLGFGPDEEEKEERGRGTGEKGIRDFE